MPRAKKYEWEDILGSLAGDDWTFGPDTRSEKQIMNSRRSALSTLKEISGMDFGFDVDAWREWLKSNPDKWLNWLLPGSATPGNLEDFLLTYPELRPK